MVLQVDTSLGGVLPQLDLVMDDDTVVPDGHDRGLAILCSLEVHVIGLPAQWGQAHVLIRALPLVKASALIGLAGKPEGIEHLRLCAEQIHPAVAPSLSPGLGHVGETELDMQGEVLKVIACGVDPFHE